MSKSPGHQQHPGHQVGEIPLQRSMQVMLDGEPIARSSAVIRVDEDGHPPRFYFPRSDVSMDALERSGTVSGCPFKGRASYFNVKAGRRELRDAAWSYEDPYDEHEALRGRLAFHDDRYADLKVEEILITAA